MPWKLRNGGRYYYRSVREGGRVRTEYVGTGPEAEAAERIDRLEALERERADKACREQRRAAEASDLAEARAFAGVEVVARLALESAGFHRHKRGRWRRRRMGEQSKVADAAGTPMPGPGPDTLELLRRAGKGDESAMPRLRELFRADPARMIRISGGDLARQVETATIKQMAAENLVFEHGLGEKMEALRGELAGPGAPAVERLLAERVALCWLEVHRWDIYHTQALQAGGVSFRQAEHYQKMRDRSHRRYLQSLRTLATVRKLGVVAIQVNIDKQQVNLAEGRARGRGQ